MAAVLVFVVDPPSLVFRPTLAHARPHFQAALAARPAAAGVEASFGFGGRFGSADARREARRSGVFGRRPPGPGPMLDPVAARAQGYSGAELNRMDPRRAAAVAAPFLAQQRMAQALQRPLQPPPPLRRGPPLRLHRALPRPGAPPTASLLKSPLAGSAEARQQVGMDMAASLQPSAVVEAEARAAAAEAWAAAVAEERETEKGAEGDAAEGAAPSWLARLAGGEVDSLGEVEVVSAVSEAAMTARAPAESLDDVAAKQRWLKSLDVPMWGRAAVALSEAASDAAGMAALSAQCDSGDDVSCRILSEQEEDSQARLARLNVPNWGAAAAVLSVAASDAAAAFGFNLKGYRPKGGASPEAEEEE
ncbi:hypothetical protein EMIHUDRAFT_461289 [Emiliania huxleyi CCMP1516]|uniref:Uncharacterized protein n=2 Tax=Emiliania huxleyi TaxID=2903 RepID=A0A0D3J3B9_EMIH1|nr:hypothetical protein EMIHUDRAFT_461289 [Emiliania huxleyi CCMP1516]EOD18004.1 hypothetical protein EMIHUDRAFT_461289 [Emiliania huxleyi CCMP1516]|eukprot:XP_005770433.1 hypothetical protein EMIHUDRAFT_461289 [Emiliania huxleyi CCMP1516]